MIAEDKILAARTALMWDHPFFGALAVRLRAVDAADDPRINTMATDGRNLFFNRKFVDGLKKQELTFVLAHEVMHNALEHHIRRQTRNPQRWNKACDYAINGELQDYIQRCNSNGTKPGILMPKGILLDAGYTGLSAEEIYRLLPDDDGNDGQGGLDPGGCGAVLDAAPAHDEAALAEARAEMQTAVRQAANIAKAANAGSLPAGIQRLVDELLKPKVDWRSVLRRFVDESTTRDFAWSRPNRRLVPHGLITPGTISIGVSHIVIAVDTSGSIDGDILRAFAAEINGAFCEGAVDRITVIYADAAVQHVEEFETGEELVLHPAGGGGTAFSDTFRTIDLDYPDVRACIYLTDLQVFDFGREPPMPVLWGVYGDPRSFDQLVAKVPFGEPISITP
jgi:predicted metal-dependent peptidase